MFRDWIVEYEDEEHDRHESFWSFELNEETVETKFRNDYPDYEIQDIRETTLEDYERLKESGDIDEDYEIPDHVGSE